MGGSGADPSAWCPAHVECQRIKQGIGATLIGCVSPRRAHAPGTNFRQPQRLLRISTSRRRDLQLYIASVTAVVRAARLCPSSARRSQGSSQSVRMSAEVKRPANWMTAREVFYLFVLSPESLQQSAAGQRCSATSTRRQLTTKN